MRVKTQDFASRDKHKTHPIRMEHKERNPAVVCERDRSGYEVQTCPCVLRNDKSDRRKLLVWL